MLYIPGAKQVGAALAIVSTVCGTDVIWLTVANKNSPKHAIIIRYGVWMNEPRGAAVRDAG